MGIANFHNFKFKSTDELKLMELSELKYELERIMTAYESCGGRDHKLWDIEMAWVLREIEFQANRPVSNEPDRPNVWNTAQYKVSELRRKLGVSH
jgi:hypothetical protein